MLDSVPEMSELARRHPTFADVLALEAQGRSVELIGGRIVEKAVPSPDHADAQGALLAFLRVFHRSPRLGAPGGWWILPEVDIGIDGELTRPDVAGWRRERVPERLRGSMASIVPDWVGEVLSPSTAHRDLGVKRDMFEQWGVSHYWTVDCDQQTLTVRRLCERGYVDVLSAGASETVRAEPFELCEFFVGQLFGIEES